MQRNRDAVRKKETSVADSKKKSMAQWFERSLCSWESGFDTRSSHTKDSKKWYLQLPSLALSTRVSVENETEMVNEI